MGILISILLIIILAGALILAICGVFCQANAPKSKKFLLFAVGLLGISFFVAWVVFGYEQEYSYASQTFNTAFDETAYDIRITRKDDHFQRLTPKRQQKQMNKAKQSYLNNKMIMQHCLKEMKANLTLFRIHDYQVMQRKMKLLTKWYQELKNDD